MNKTELRNKILKLDGLTNDEKSALVELLNKQKKYGLVWEDKPEDVEERLREELPVLIEDKSKAIISDDADAPNHILIEGDNLEALTALSYTHEGMVDVIYIDPPYNTGNNDFVYNDRFVDKEDTYRHSKWLSFMNKRLRIAKQLLSDKGVIFISIDDNEQAQLKMLCDEVFGENNFISSLVWQSTPGSNTGNDIKTVTENVLLYSLNKCNATMNTRPIEDSEKYKYEDCYVSTRGRYVVNKLDRRMTGSHYSEALNYPIELPNGKKLFPGGKNYKQEHWNWRWSSQKVQWGIENGFIEFKESGSSWVIYFKQYLKVDNNNNPIERALPYQNLILYDGISSARGTKDVMDVFNKKAFDYPKPLNLISLILRMSTNQGSTILDFFAGSGTTLHATMQLNSEDGGNRKCILVTNNENNICEEVTYERNKRVINGYITPKGEEVEGLHNNNLRYYRTSFVGRSRTPKNMRQLMSLATDMLCIKEDLYDEKKQFGELPTHPKVMRYFTKGDSAMLVIYYEAAIAEIVEQIEKMDFKAKLKVYVFSPSEDPWEEDFEFVNDKVELCALPAAIYNTYKRILPKKKDELISIDTNVESETETAHNGAATLFDNLEEGGEQ